MNRKDLLEYYIALAKTLGLENRDSYLYEATGDQLLYKDLPVVLPTTEHLNSVVDENGVTMKIPFNPLTTNVLKGTSISMALMIEIIRRRLEYTLTVYILAIIEELTTDTVSKVNLQLVEKISQLELKESFYKSFFKKISLYTSDIIIINVIRKNIKEATEPKTVFTFNLIKNKKIGTKERKIIDIILNNLFDSISDEKIEYVSKDKYYPEFTSLMTGYVDILSTIQEKLNFISDDVYVKVESLDKNLYKTVNTVLRNTSNTIPDIGLVNDKKVVSHETVSKPVVKEMNPVSKEDKDFLSNLGKTTNRETRRPYDRQYNNNISNDNVLEKMFGSSLNPRQLDRSNGGRMDRRGPSRGNVGRSNFQFDNSNRRFSNNDDMPF